MRSRAPWRRRSLRPPLGLAGARRRGAGFPPAPLAGPPPGGFGARLRGARLGFSPSAGAASLGRGGPAASRVRLRGAGLGASRPRGAASAFATRRRGARLGFGFLRPATCAVRPGRHDVAVRIGVALGATPPSRGLRRRLPTVSSEPSSSADRRHRPRPGPRLPALALLATALPAAALAPLGKLRSSSRASAAGLRDIRVRAPLMTSSASAVCGSAAASTPRPAAGPASARRAPAGARCARAAPPDEFTSSPSSRFVSGQRCTAYSSCTSRVSPRTPRSSCWPGRGADLLLRERLQHDLDALALLSRGQPPIISIARSKASASRAPRSPAARGAAAAGSCCARPRSAGRRA